MPPLYGGAPAVLGRSQVVRQRILIPPFPGSNPGAPANQVEGPFRTMRSLIVVAVDEVIELGLLLQEVVASQLCGFRLQGRMHAFMAAILLRVAGLDALDRDAETQPPTWFGSHKAQYVTVRSRPATAERIRRGSSSLKSVPSTVAQICRRMSRTLRDKVSPTLVPRVARGVLPGRLPFVDTSGEG